MTNTKSNKSASTKFLNSDIDISDGNFCNKLYDKSCINQRLIALRATPKGQSNYFSCEAGARSAIGHWLVQNKD